MPATNIKIGLWGGHPYSVIAAEKIYSSGFVISFVVTAPDKPSGRNLAITPSPLKLWAIEHSIPVLQPEKLKEEEFVEILKKYDCTVYVVMAYGKIIPENILNIPKAGSLNIHPSLLPKFRGPSPVESSILADEKNTGVTIIKMDAEMDHGPIVEKRQAMFDEWPLTTEEIGTKLVEIGTNALIAILPEWIAGNIKAVEQDHSQATYTKKFEKEDAKIDLNDDPYQNYLKIKAFDRSPNAFFFTNDKKRIKITQASFKEGKLIIEKVIPEGKKEMKYQDFQ